MTSPNAVLLFGAHGQLGARLYTALSKAGYEVTALTREEWDLTYVDSKSLAARIRAVHPAIIINAAAYTSVDKAESAREQSLAEVLNHQFPALLAALAQAEDIPVLHFSTDYVFDGTQGPYTESAPTRPLNRYGETKRAGEEAVAQSGGYVFRLQWVYDHRGQNFLTTMQRVMAEKEEIRIVADQRGAPSFAGHLADAITQAVPQMLARQLPPGIYHLTAGGDTSWHGFACAIANACKLPTRIIPITSEEYPLPAIRPRDARLDCGKLAQYGITLPHWRTGLSACLQDALHLVP